MIKSYIKIFLISLLFIKCNAISNTKSGSQKPSITVSVLPQKYFIERIADTLVDVNVMIPSGADHTSYEPSMRQIRLMSNSVAYFISGNLEYEVTWIEKLKASAPKTKFIELSKGIRFIEGECSHGDETHNSEEHHGGVDPHIWMSPKNAKIIAANTLNALSELFPKHKKEFEAKFKLLISDIDKLDEQIIDKLSESTSKTFLIFHPSLGYFANDYGLQQLSIEFEGKAPSPANMKSIIDEGREEHVKAIFIQKQFDTTKAETIAEELNAKIIIIDPLSADWLQQMEYITDQLAIALH